MKNRFVDSFLPPISRLILSPANASCSLSQWGPETETLTKIHHIPGDFTKEVTLCKVLSAESFNLVPPPKAHQQDLSSGTKPSNWETQPRFVFSTVLEGHRGRTDTHPQRSHGMSLLKATSRDPTSEWRDSAKRFRNLCRITENRAGKDLISSCSPSLLKYPQQQVVSWMCHF